MHCSHPAPAGHSAPSCRAGISFAIGALLFVLSSQGGCSRNTSPFAGSRTLSPVELFQRVSPSVFVVQSLDDNGKTLMLGSGVALAPDFLITNCHVVQSSSSLKVSRGKENWTAKLIEAAPNHDLCGLRPTGLTLQAADIRPSSKLATGEHVYAIGSPEGLELTFSEGVISALRDTEGVRMVQTSAAISPGSSGGGLFDAQGNLVGITTFYLKEGQSLNFALPGEWIKALRDSLIQNSKESPSRQGDAALESTAWLLIGQEAVKDENYDLAARSFHKSVDLKEGDAFQSSLELGRLWARGGSSWSWWELSDKYKDWLCSAVQCQRGLAEPEVQDQAITAFRESIQLKPDNVAPWLALAGEYADKKQYDQAVSAAKEATRLAPGDSHSWLEVAVIYVEAGFYAEARDALQRAEKLAPSDQKVNVLAWAGTQYADMKDHEQVMRIYHELRASAPKTAEKFFKEYVLP
jgi:tetratricopeptide (TPR) repeat protein